MLTRASARGGSGGGGGGGTEYATEMGRTEYGPDRVTVPSAPAGMLFSCWTRLKTPISTYPDSRGNLNIIDMIFSNWRMRCIGHNTSASSAVDCLYNANSMIFADGTSVGEGSGSWAGDYTFFFEPGRPVEVVNEFTFHAWQCVINAGTSTITLRQWVRHYGEAVQGPQESILSFTTLRNDLVASSGWVPANAAAWTPSDVAVSLEIGEGNGMFLHARMDDVDATAPSNAAIEAISDLTSADLTAWADWPMNFEAGDLNFADRSGNGRNLVPGMGGTFYQGPAAPWPSGGGGGEAPGNRMPGRTRLRLLSRQPQ